MSNTIVISGNVGKDPELRTTQGGTKVCSFSIASKTRKDKTTWFNCACFGKTAEMVMQYVKKGSLISVVGFVEIDKKDDKTYVNVTADKVHFLGGKKQDEAKSETETKQDDDDGEIPF